jgi:hypothetical protein
MMKPVELKVMIVIEGKEGIMQYSCPYCCKAGQVIQETFPFDLVSRVAKGLIEFEGINKVCGKCKKTFPLVATEVIKNTLRPYQ